MNEPLETQDTVSPLPYIQLVAADVVASTQWLLALAFRSTDAADCLGEAGCAPYTGDLDAFE